MKMREKYSMAKEIVNWVSQFHRVYSLPVPGGVAISGYDPIMHGYVSKSFIWDKETVREFKFGIKERKETSWKSYGRSRRQWAKNQ